MLKISVEMVEDLLTSPRPVALGRLYSYLDHFGDLGLDLVVTQFDYTEQGDKTMLNITEWFCDAVRRDEAHAQGIANAIQHLFRQVFVTSDDKPMYSIATEERS
jgi:hypothetical protein